MRNAAAQYRRTSEAGMSGTNAERAAFTLIIRELHACTPGPTRVHALGRNHTLWSLLVQDLSLAENRLPEGIKTALVSLGLWAMRYSTLALLKDLPIEPLINVNQNVVEGLLAQADAAETAMRNNVSEQGNTATALHGTGRNQDLKAPISV